MTPSREFIRFAIAARVLSFGDFTLKAGRVSPYFFNAGLFNDGATLGRLAQFYAERLLRAEAERGEPLFDGLYGPAYKGIALASAMAVALAQRGRNLPFSFNRKETKDHGEGGSLVGAPLAGRVAIIDDVISAGTSIGESVAMIRAHGAEPAAVFIALDRMERAGDAIAVRGESAVQHVRDDFGIEVHALATLDDLLDTLEEDGEREQSHAAHRIRIADYRARFGSVPRVD